jgi:hypothetical protein
MSISRFVCICLAWFVMLLPLAAQTASTDASAAVQVPRLIRLTGTLNTPSPAPAPGNVVNITFSLYKEETGGTSLWQETQNVDVDATGHYTVLLGTTQTEGLPIDLFTSGQAQWLGVRPQGEAEQPRIMLVSVPFALKARDAETIGGLSPSAFVLAAPPVGGSVNNAATASASPWSASSSSASPATSSDVTTTGGTVNAVPLFTTSTNVQNSIVTQTGTTSVSVAGALMLPATGAATSAAGKNSQPQDFVASSFNSSTGTAENQTFQWRAEPAANDTTSPSGTLNLLYGLGTATPTETGLKLSSTGQFSFATGQTFPGTGTITGITTASGSGLAGGGTSGTLSLSVPAAGISNTMLKNSSLTVMAGTDLSGGGSVALGGTVTLNLNTAKIPQLATANTFTANQTITGTMSATSSTAGASAVSGTNSATTGTSTGVSGTTASASGYGVSGLNNAKTGTAIAVNGISKSTSGIGVSGLNSATTGTTFGVSGTAASPTGIGVYGVNTAATGNAVGVWGVSNNSTGVPYGVLGTTTSTTGVGVSGQNTATKGTGYGVQGTSASPSGVGVSGSNSATTGAANGVTGASASPSGTGVFGVNTATTSTAAGVYGSTQSTAGVGVYGVATATTGSASGVYATTASPGGSGVQGINSATTGNAIGVYGQSPGGSGVYGTSNGGYGVYGVNTASGYGVYGSSVSGVAILGVCAATGSNICYNGVAGENTSTSGGNGLWGLTASSAGNAAYLVNTGGGNLLFGTQSDGGSGTFYVQGNGSGYYAGDLTVVGAITAGTKDFKIDHPLDPANKYLVHASVESSEMMNIYTGNITTDGDGAATVQLPEWFEALNRDFRYQLTVMGQFAQAIVADEIANHHFRIKTDKPNVKVSWQVTGVRHDAFANANRLQVEEEKARADRGHYLHPELFGASKEARISQHSAPHQAPAMPSPDRPLPVRAGQPQPIIIPAAQPLPVRHE